MALINNAIAICGGDMTDTSSFSYEADWGFSTNNTQEWQRSPAAGEHHIFQVWLPITIQKLKTALNRPIHLDNDMEIEWIL